MRIFGSDRISGLMQRLGMEEGVPIEHGMVTRAIERAQKQVEAQNFGVRKHLLEYDDVMNKQRENIYTLRRQLLEGQDSGGRGRRPDRLARVPAGGRRGRARRHRRALRRRGDGRRGVGSRARSARKCPALFALDAERLRRHRLRPDVEHGRDPRRALGSHPSRATTRRRSCLGPELLRKIERDIMLQIVDAQWKDHLYSLDHLKEGIGLRGYGQRDPLVEYKRESFTLFQDMKARVDEEMVRAMWWLRPMISEDGAPGVARRGVRRRAADAAHPQRPERGAEQRLRRWSRRQRIGGGGRGAGVRLRTEPVRAVEAETGPRRRRRRRSRR